jgi:hypothetical protein
VAGFEPDGESSLTLGFAWFESPVSVFDLASLGQKTGVAGVPRANAVSEWDYATAANERSE